jgi:fatty acid-binding protein DegV
MSKEHILTVSTSDVPPEMVSRLCIAVVPAYVQTNNRSYRDESLIT